MEKNTAQMGDETKSPDEIDEKDILRDFFDQKLSIERATFELRRRRNQALNITDETVGAVQQCTSSNPSAPKKKDVKPQIEECADALTPHSPSPHRPNNTYRLAAESREDDSNYDELGSDDGNVKIKWIEKNGMDFDTVYEMYELLYDGINLKDEHSFGMTQEMKLHEVRKISNSLVLLNYPTEDSQLERLEVTIGYGKVKLALILDGEEKICEYWNASGGTWTWFEGDVRFVKNRKYQDLAASDFSLIFKDFNTLNFTTFEVHHEEYNGWDPKTFSFDELLENVILEDNSLEISQIDENTYEYRRRQIEIDDQPKEDNQPGSSSSIYERKRRASLIRMDEFAGTISTESPKKARIEPQIVSCDRSESRKAEASESPENQEVKKEQYRRGRHRANEKVQEVCEEFAQKMIISIRKGDGTVPVIYIPDLLFLRRISKSCCQKAENLNFEKIDRLELNIVDKKKVQIVIICPHDKRIEVSYHGTKHGTQIFTGTSYLVEDTNWNLVAAAEFFYILKNKTINLEELVFGIEYERGLYDPYPDGSSRKFVGQFLYWLGETGQVHTKKLEFVYSPEHVAEIIDQSKQQNHQIDWVALGQPDDEEIDRRAALLMDPLVFARRLAQAAVQRDGQYGGPGERQDGEPWDEQRNPHGHPQDQQQDHIQNHPVVHEQVDGPRLGGEDAGQDRRQHDDLYRLLKALKDQTLSTIVLRLPAKFIPPAGHRKVVDEFCSNLPQWRQALYIQLPDGKMNKDWRQLGHFRSVTINELETRDVGFIDNEFVENGRAQKLTIYVYGRTDINIPVIRTELHVLFYDHINHQQTSFRRRIEENNPEDLLKVDITDRSFRIKKETAENITAASTDSGVSDTVTDPAREYFSRPMSPGLSGFDSSEGSDLEMSADEDNGPLVLMRSYESVHSEVWGAHASGELSSDCGSAQSVGPQVSPDGLPSTSSEASGHSPQEPKLEDSEDH
ncbi:unnamed protein product [Caenorhabditis nigoni]